MGSRVKIERQSQQEGLFSDEIVKIETNMKVTVPETGKWRLKK